MRKIKFKSEYKPLSDQAIDRHKNFDGLMKLYAAGPKPNLFNRIFKNKWTMFSGGFILGTLITTFFITQNTQHDEPIAMNTINQPGIESTQETSDRKTAAGKESLLQNAPGGGDEHNVETPSQPDEEKNAGSKGKINSTTANNQGLPVNSGTGKMGRTEKANEDKSGQPAETSGRSFATGIPEPGQSVDHQIQDKNPEQERSRELAVVKVETLKISSIHASHFQRKSENISLAQIDKSLEKTIYRRETPESLNNIFNNRDSGNIGEKHSENINKIKYSENLLDRIFSFNIFKKDSLNINSPANDSTVAVRADSSLLNKSMIQANDTSFIQRYAQLTFISPVGTNGLDGRKYKEHLSVNILAGLNGAVDGVEGAGIANVDMGYVNGVQGAGVANFVNGTIHGVQGAGVVNYAKDIRGVQGAGVMNVSIGSVNGVQGAGVINYAKDAVTGLQASGVFNISTTKKYSHYFQASGVGNISLADSSKGVQVSGVFNVANGIHGAQIGLINVSKNIHGVQIGLINIADTLDGFPIGLISISRNGIFDVDVFTNDMFNYNLGIRVGSKNIYNVFAFGITPATDTAAYGYGLGIGGQIPIARFFVDIDAMTWNVHKDKFEFNYDNLHLVNQLRITPGFTINKYISVYAGPEINVEVFNNTIVPLNTTAFATYIDTNVTTKLSLGYVAGIRFF